MKRSPILPIKNRTGMFVVLTPHAVNYITTLQATVVMDFANNLFYLTKAKRKLPLYEIDSGARLVQLSVDEDKIGWTYDPL